MTNINLYNLYQKSSVWCFAFSHTFTFELIPQSRDRPVGSLGDSWWRNGSFPCRTMNTDRDPKDSATQRALRLEERNFRAASASTSEEERKDGDMFGHCLDDNRSTSPLSRRGSDRSLGHSWYRLQLRLFQSPRHANGEEPRGQSESGLFRHHTPSSRTDVVRKMEKRCLLIHAFVRRFRQES